MSIGPYEASLREQAIAVRARLSPRHVLVQEQRRADIRPYPKHRPLPAPAVVFVNPVARQRPDAYRPIVKSITLMVEVDSPFQWRHIADEVCAKHNLSFEQMCSDQRRKDIVAARFETFYRLSTETSMSLPQIGRRIGGKDHTTVLHGIRQYKARMLEASER